MRARVFCHSLNRVQRTHEAAGSCFADVGVRAADEDRYNTMTQDLAEKFRSTPGDRLRALEAPLVAVLRKIVQYDYPPEVVAGLSPIRGAI